MDGIRKLRSLYEFVYLSNSYELAGAPCQKIAYIHKFLPLLICICRQKYVV